MPELKRFTLRLYLFCARESEPGVIRVQDWLKFSGIHLYKKETRPRASMDVTRSGFCILFADRKTYLQLGNWKEAMRVLQLKVPLLFKYSLV